MAEDDMPDYDSFDGVLDWIYIEDDFPLADELAEQQIPDPGYAGTRFEIEMMEMDDFDLYDYWEDLNYGDDEYWDHGGTNILGQKRKRQSAKNVNTNNEKRRKLSLRDTSGGSVLFIDMSTRLEMAWAKPAVFKGGKSFALLPDWRLRFSAEAGMIAEKEMPAAMKKAAEAQEEDTPDSFEHSNAMTATEEEEGWEDEMDAVDGQEVPAELAKMDPDVLKGFLRQRMSEMGLGNMDEAAFMDTMMKMLSGEEGADDATAMLANNILGQATEGNDEALSGWLSKQGVSIDAAEENDDDEMESGVTAEPSDKSGRKGLHGSQVSPSDSAIDMARSSHSAATRMPIHGSSPLASGRKRAAPKNDLATESAKKRKVTLQAASSSDSASASQQDSVLEGPDEAQAALEAPEDENILVSQSSLDGDKQTRSKAEAANTTAVKQNQTTASKSTTPSKPKSKKLEEGLVEEEDSIDVASAPAKATRSQKAEVDVEAKEKSGAGAPAQGDTIEVAPAKSTRKRKAQQDGEIDKSAPKPKKHAKKTSAAAAAAVEPAGRKARNTRAAARAGK